MTLADGAELGAFVACYVLITALAGPVLAKFADRLHAARSRRGRTRQGTPVSA